MTRSERSLVFGLSKEDSNIDSLKKDLLSNDSLVKNVPTEPAYNQSSIFDKENDMSTQSSELSFEQSSELSFEQSSELSSEKVPDAAHNIEYMCVWCLTIMDRDKLSNTCNNKDCIGLICSECSPELHEWYFKNTPQCIACQRFLAFDEDSDDNEIQMTERDSNDMAEGNTADDNSDDDFNDDFNGSSNNTNEILDNDILNNERVLNERVLNERVLNEILSFDSINHFTQDDEHDCCLVFINSIQRYFNDLKKRFRRFVGMN